MMAGSKEQVHGSVCLSNQCGQVGGGLESKSFVKDPTAMSGTFQGWLIWTRFSGWMLICAIQDSFAVGAAERFTLKVPNWNTGVDALNCYSIVSLWFHQVL